MRGVRAALLLCAAGFAASSCAPKYFLALPYVCDEWTREADGEYQQLGDGPLADQIASWDDTCALNHSLIGKEWPRPQKPKRPWWRWW